MCRQHTYNGNGLQIRCVYNIRCILRAAAAYVFYVSSHLCMYTHVCVYASTSRLFVSFAARCYGRFSRRNQPMRHCRCNAGQVSTPCLTLLPPDITTWRCILSPQLPWPLVDAVGHSAECLSDGTVSVRPSVRLSVCPVSGTAADIDR